MAPTVPKIYFYEFRTLLQAQRQRLLVEVQDIEVALARIADGSYGVCIDCGGEIDRARLKADPTVKRCPPCQVSILPSNTDGEK
jgi:DnaK suppressor protein